MLEAIKKSMRISHNGLDDDINNNINACRMELDISGVCCTDNDALFQKACELYVKWQFDYQEKGERYEKAFRNLKDAMALCGDYNVRSTN